MTYAVPGDDGTRTHNLLRAKQMLLPVELRPRMVSAERLELPPCLPRQGSALPIGRSGHMKQHIHAGNPWWRMRATLPPLTPAERGFS